MSLGNYCKNRDVFLRKMIYIRSCKRVVCIICENKGKQLGVDGTDQYFFHILLSTEHD